MVGKVALGQIFLRVLRFPSVSIILPMLHTHLHLHVALTEGQTGEAWELFKNNAVSEIGEHSIEKYFYLICDGLEKALPSHSIAFILILIFVNTRCY
jgi:hypothetical protein